VQEMWSTGWGEPSVFDAPAPHPHFSGPIITASEASTQSPADKHCEHMTRRWWVMRSDSHGVCIDRYPVICLFLAGLKSA
jgi:hypothetical protein